MIQGSRLRRVAAVLVAGGRGLRFDEAGCEGKSSNAGTAKQYLDLAGRPVYAWSLSALARHDQIETIALVVEDSLVESVSADAPGYIPGHESKLSVTAGGASRQESVFRGLELLEKKSGDGIEAVIVHDAARPFLSRRLIDDVINGIEAGQACTAGLPVSDTVKRIRNGTVSETIDREGLYTVQTPQGAELDALISAHRKAREENWSTTDDAGIMERWGAEVVIVQGSAWNFKVTTKEDLDLLKALSSEFMRLFAENP